MSLIVITGGGIGIGEQITRAFHDAGHSVLIISRQDRGLAVQLGERAKFVSCDVAKRSEWAGVEKVLRDWNLPVNAWINNAGFSEWRQLEEIDEVFMDSMIDTNLKGVIWGSQVAARHLCSGGSIINVSSLAGKRGSANNSVYCATKFGVNGVTQSLAKELGPRGIRVNAICPVYVQTDGLLEALEAKVSPTGGLNAENYLKEFTKSNTALHRLPTAHEIAKTALFLASFEASAITGQCLNVDCGVLPQ